MYLNHFESSEKARLEQVLATLKNIHGVQINIDLESPNASALIKECQTTWLDKKNQVVAENSFNSYQQNPEYIKSMLILEAMKLMLTEIAPKRRRKTKMAESSDTMPPKTTLSTQLSQLAKLVPQHSEESAAFSNILASISDKISNKSNLSADENQVMSWIKSQPKPINVKDMLAKGVAKFGRQLASQRMQHIKDLPKVPDIDVMQARPAKAVNPGVDNVHSQLNESDTLEHIPGQSSFRQAHYYEYQASMARSELYRNGKYAMSMMKQVDPNGEIQPWIAGCLTKAANILDKIYHYLDYYKTFEPDQLPEDIDNNPELGETSGSIARENLMLIIEYSTKLFNMIQPGDKLEGWVAMKLTTASECISSSKHYLDYVQFEQHALDSHFDESQKLKKTKLKEADMDLSGDAGSDPSDEQIAKATLIINAKALSAKIQDIAETVAKIGPNDLMPLVDAMRTQFGQDAASGFNETVKTALDNLLNITTETKENIDNAVSTLQSGGVPGTPSDIEKIGNTLPSSSDSTVDNDLAALDKSSTPDADEPENTEPLGRSKKDISETAQNDKDIEQAKQEFFNKGGKVQHGKPKWAKGSERHRRSMRGGHLIKPGSAKDELGVALNKFREGKMNMQCNECGMGTYMESADGNMRCNKCGAMMVDEAWDTTMHTAKKDIGKWDGYTLAELKAKKAKLMKKEARSAAEQKTVRQLNFAIRAKQKDHWGDIKESQLDEAKKAKDPGAVATAQVKEMGKKYWTGEHLTKLGIKKRDEIIRAIEKEKVDEAAKKSKPDFLDVDGDGNKKESFKKALADKKKQDALKQGKGHKKVSETEVNEKAPPGKKAEEFIKSNKAAFMKKYGKKGTGILYATAWKQFGPKNESFVQASSQLPVLKGQLRMLEDAFDLHQSAFQTLLAEGKVSDPLQLGYGLQGDALLQQIKHLGKKIKEQESVLRYNISEGIKWTSNVLAMQNKIAQLIAIKESTPYGVTYTDSNGSVAKKLFETEEVRNYWINLNKETVTNIKIINPDSIDAAIQKYNKG